MKAQKWLCRDGRRLSGAFFGGALGGRFGGFGKKKKEEAPKVSEPEVPAASPSSDGMLMMESLTDTSGFSTDSIGEEVFAIPAGFAKVEPDFGKRRKK